MEFIVGITNNTEKKKKYWTEKKGIVFNWQVIASDLSIEEAFNTQLEICSIMDCSSAALSEEANTRYEWCVYCFDYEN